MITKKFWCGIILAIAIVIFNFVSTSQAEVQTYIGFGVHYMEDENETLAQAQEKAKLDAEFDAMSQVSINVQSYSNMHNSNLTRDEIITITAGIMNIKNVKYSIQEAFEGVILIQAEVTAEIDTDRIAELVEREIQHRTQN